jgi:hypothetical protein
MNADLADLNHARLELVAVLLDRIRQRHNPRVEERLLREHETWLDAGYALRLLRPEEGEA